MDCQYKSRRGGSVVCAPAWSNASQREVPVQFPALTFRLQKRRAPQERIGVAKKDESGVRTHPHKRVATRLADLSGGGVRTT